MKEIDWIPYLTTRLVDDAASHFRLFKQALAKTTFIEKKSPRNSPHKSQSPKRSHKRNKSETDIWHYGIKNVDFRGEIENDLLTLMYPSLILQNLRKW